MIDSINPAVKTVVTMLASIVLMLLANTYLNVAIILVCLVFVLSSRRANLRRFVALLLPALLLSISFFFSGWKLYAGPEGEIAANTAVNTIDFGHAAFASPSLQNGLQLGSRILAFALLGLSYSLTTDKFELITSFRQQFKMSRAMAYGILAAFHLIPSIRSEYEKSKLALRIRNVKLLPFFDTRPVFVMLTRIIRYSDNVALAMEAKGFSEKASSRTNEGALGEDRR